MAIWGLNNRVFFRHCMKVSSASAATSRILETGMLKDANRDRLPRANGHDSRDFMGCLNQDGLCLR
ncbi:MAG: hypothetical protein A3J24_03690 [Deltaproteobacteria bacterium RIFCSPLOWO2_02_FULL_53_8]|nr:MAG: hypothetical protein A3J24_03690 [Deltaproteobacteria bacterium RIFCSPLOWO2_02_FULL_53_8]